MAIKHSDMNWFVRGTKVKRDDSNSSNSSTYANSGVSDFSSKKSIVLAKGMYDDTACKLYNKSKSGHGYIAGTLIDQTQKELISLGFLKEDKPDGDYGEKTEKAVKDFQTAALKPERLIRNGINLSKAPSITYFGKADGICEKRTDDEMELWKSKNWIKPVKCLKHGDSEPEVRMFQNYLKDTGVYLGCASDGWFWNKMRYAVYEFQEAAEKGRFLVKGVLTDMGIKLTGHREGELCVKTQEYLIDAAEKKAIVPKRCFDEPVQGEVSEGLLNLKFITPEEGQKIVAIAKTWVGTPYLTTGNAKDGADCSGSVNGIYCEAGYPFPRISSSKFPSASEFKPSPDNLPQNGDVGCWDGHVMIYDENAGLTRKGEIANGWSASNPKPNSPPFGTARYQWFNDHYKTSVRWYRYVKSK